MKEKSLIKLFFVLIAGGISGVIYFHDTALRIFSDLMAVSGIALVIRRLRRFSR